MTTNYTLDLNTGIGRFISRDTWIGDYRRPLSLNRWGYVAGNPVNRVDPSGRYHDEVHLDLTRDLVRQVASGFPNYLFPNDAGYSLDSLAQVIANADINVDHKDNTNPYVCPKCLFLSWASTIAHVNEAITSRNPYLFGATLHQLQDYYTHWGEGYTPPTGHGLHTAKYWARDDWDYSDFFKGGHFVRDTYGNRIWYEVTYGHLRKEVLQDIRFRNPGFDPSSLSDDELMNLYLRRDPEFANANERFEERDYYGIDPEMYIAGTHRDRLMEESTRRYIKMFFDELAGDSCNIDWSIPEDSIIKELLLRE